MPCIGIRFGEACEQRRFCPFLALDEITDRFASSSEGNAFLEAVRLEDFLDWKGRSLFIKMDIEGHELAALKGAGALLSNNRCFLQVEVFPENEQQVTAYLTKLGFVTVCQIDRDFYFNRPDVGSWRS